MATPAPFEQLCSSHSSYPENISSETICITPHKSLRSRLGHQAKRLCSADGAPIEVACREIVSGDTTPYRDLLIKGEQELKKWFTHMSISPSVQQSEAATRIDPSCRLIFIYAKNSRTNLKISKNGLTTIFSYHQVMPSFLEFIFPFGKQDNLLDISYSGFRRQTRFEKPVSPLPNVLSALGRSGRHFQLCYNIRSVSSTEKVENGVRTLEWTTRQTAIHHQFDIEKGNALWIIVGGRSDIKKTADSITDTTNNSNTQTATSPSNNFRVTLAIHLAYIHWAAENWRWYIQYLERKFAENTDIAVYGLTDFPQQIHNFMPSNTQDVQRLEDSTRQATDVLDGNTEIFTSLHNYYKELLDNALFSLKDRSENDIHEFLEELNGIIFDQKMQAQRLRLLAQKISDRKTLINQLLQVESTAKAESLSLSMRDLTIGAQKEAIIMRIITIVTLVFLPATFVSTLFSTDIVSYQNDDRVETFSGLALQRWFELAGPLTAVTFILGVIALIRVRQKQKHQFAKDVPIRVLAHSNTLGPDLERGLEEQRSWKAAG